MRRGFTVVEMIVVLSMTTILLVGAFSAYANAIGFEDRVRASRGGQEGRTTEERLRGLLARAALSTVNTDTSSYFVGGEETDASTLTFTALGERPGASFLASNEPFETANERFGAQGGTAEVSLSLTGIGEGASRTGLFLRVQRPADGDPAQGGEQELLDAEVETISFEFWTGESWTTTWNTQAQSTPRLPSAVRVTLRRSGEDADRSFVVGVPSSDATAANPVVVGGEQA